jgi:two-component system response regulator PilR (NtrC family)
VLLARIAHESGVPAIELTPEQLAAIMQAPLAGNVRELENLLYRTVALGGARDSGLGDLDPLGTAPGEMPYGAVHSQPAQPAAVRARLPQLQAPVRGQGLAAWLDEQERQCWCRRFVNRALTWRRRRSAWAWVRAPCAGACSAWASPWRRAMAPCPGPR